MNKKNCFGSALILSVLAFLISVVGTPAIASPIYTVTIGSDSHVVDPLERAMTAADYYNYDIVVGIGEWQPGFWHSRC
jgi:hypothetical protein